MKGIAKNSQEYVDAMGLKRWLGLDLEFDQDVKSPEEALVEVELKVRNAIAKSNGQVILDSSIAPGPSPIINVGRTSEDTIVADLIREIYQCTELGGDHGLLSFERLALRYPEAEGAYNVMKNKLKKP